MQMIQQHRAFLEIGDIIRNMTGMARIETIIQINDGAEIIGYNIMLTALNDGIPFVRKDTKFIVELQKNSKKECKNDLH